MKLDRNIEGNRGRGKYALLKLRRVAEITAQYSDIGQSVANAMALLERVGILDWGDTIDSEFFVIRLKDRYSDDALFRYALSARYDGNEDYAREIVEMAERAGPSHPNCKRPD